jgi:hypothetical protein
MQGFPAVGRDPLGMERPVHVVGAGKAARVGLRPYTAKPL